MRESIILKYSLIIAKSSSCTLATSRDNLAKYLMKFNQPCDKSAMNQPKINKNNRSKNPKPCSSFL